MQNSCHTSMERLRTPSEYNTDPAVGISRRISWSTTSLSGQNPRGTWLSASWNHTGLTAKKAIRTRMSVTFLSVSVSSGLNALIRSRVLSAVIFAIKDSRMTSSEDTGCGLKANWGAELEEAEAVVNGLAAETGWKTAVEDEDTGETNSVSVSCEPMSSTMSPSNSSSSLLSSSSAASRKRFLVTG